MNSAFLGYLLTGDKPSTTGSVLFEAPFHEKIPSVKGNKNAQFRQITLSASKEALTLVHQNNPESDFSWENIVGVTVETVPISTYPNFSSSKDQEDVHILQIHFFGKRSEKAGAKREEFDREFLTPDLNLAVAWKNLILQTANNPNFVPTDYKDIATIPTFRRFLFVFINPNSGTKQGMKVWNQAKPFLRKCGITYVEFFTEHQNHARDYLLDLDASTLKEVDGLIAVSGDGIPHEIVNGIFGRQDWESFKDIPIGLLPGGSAGALCKNVLDRSNEEMNLLSSCYLIVKGKTIKSDLAMFEGVGDRKVFSFLSFTWGFFARLDIDSEKLRCIGNARFTVYALMGIAKLKVDRAKITFSSTSNKLPALNEEIKGDEWKTIDDDFAYFVIQNMAYLDGTSKGAPLAEVDDGYLHFMHVNGEKNSRKHLFSILTNIETGLFEGDVPMASTGLGFDKMKAFRFEPATDGYFSIDGEKYEGGKVCQASVMEKVLTLYSTK